MKTLLFIISALIYTSQMWSQNWLLSGNNPTAGQFLGTTSATDIRFHTNGAQRMVLRGTGNVGFLGLGVTAPASMFHLADYSSGNLFRTDGALGNYEF